MKRVVLVVATLVIFIGILAASKSWFGITNVFRLPAGFVELGEVSAKSEGILRAMFWESQISLLDVDGICIFQTDVKDRNFIVRYNGKTYVDAEKYFAFAETARITSEQREHEYRVGDVIELRGIRDGKVSPYYVTIADVKTEVLDEETKWEIRISVEPEALHHEGVKFFDRALTSSGRGIEFTLIDDETVCISHPIGEQIKWITVKSPDYRECKRKIVVDESTEDNVEVQLSL